MSAMVREAHAVLHLAMEAPGRAKTATQIIALAGWLDAYAELDAGEVPGDWAFPELRDDADPDGEALRKAAREVEAAAGDLVKAMAAHCGQGHNARPLALAGITAGGDAGTASEMTIPGAGK
jgi:hypothetical protein